MQLGRRAAGSRAGLTLLELMFALTVMAVGVLAAFSSQVSSIELLRSTRENDAALGQLRAAMEEVLTRMPTNLTGDFPPGSVLAKDGYDFNPMSLSEFQVQILYPNMVGAVVPDPLEVRLVATWQDFRGRPREQALNTMVVR